MLHGWLGFVGLKRHLRNVSIGLVVCLVLLVFNIPMISQRSASDLIGRGAKQIEQSSEAVRKHKAIEKKPGLNPEYQV